jgi:crotonobetainyl-CoA:carnitine CoA-transferase CaiB-like acyl-CoA transferase
MAIAQSVLAALVHRARTGEGQEIEIPMLETMVAFNVIEHQRGATFEPPEGPFGYHRLLSPDRRPFRSADGWVAILPYDDRHWREFLALAGRGDLLDDPRFADHNARIANIDAAYAVIAEASPSRTTAEWVVACEAASIPCSAVLDLSAVTEDPHLAEVGMMEVVDHPTEGPYWYVREAPRCERTPTALHRHAALLGEHTDEVLREAGFDDASIAELVAAGAAHMARGLRTEAL